MEATESPISASPVSNSPPPLPPPPPFNMSAAEKTLVGGGEGNFSSGGMVVFSGGRGDLAGGKKRGRPRKYDADGNLNPAYKSPPPPTAVPGFGVSAPSGGFTGPKRGRGKASGAGSWQMLGGLGELFLNTSGGEFTPHVVNVPAGEDVASKIISLCQNGLGVCVLSANGMVSNVTIRQPGSSGGLLTYEGRFEILSLKGSFTVSENGGIKCRTGGLSVSLASPDGRVLGGGLAGLLVAASPIQMVVASFMQNGNRKTPKRKQCYEPHTTPLTPASADTVICATPVSEAAPHVNSNFPVPGTQERLHSYGDSHNNQSQNNGAHNNDNNSMSEKQNPNTSSDSGEWNIPEPNSGHRAYHDGPDINLSLLVD